MSKPRPIHQLHRDLRLIPDEKEPSYSYEQEGFLGQAEDFVEDEFHRRLHLAEDHFHRRLQSTGRRETSTTSATSSGGGSTVHGSGGGSGSGSQLTQHLHNSSGSLTQTSPLPQPSTPVTAITSSAPQQQQQQPQMPAVPGSGSFWRTDSNNNWQQGPSFSSMSMKSPTSSANGRLGAVLQLHSETTTTPVAAAAQALAAAGSPILNGGNVVVMASSSSSLSNTTNQSYNHHQHHHRNNSNNNNIGNTSPVLSGMDPRTPSLWTNGVDESQQQQQQQQQLTRRETSMSNASSAGGGLVVNSSNNNNGLTTVTGSAAAAPTIQQRGESARRQKEFAKQRSEARRRKYEAQSLDGIDHGGYTEDVESTGETMGASRDSSGGTTGSNEGPNPRSLLYGKTLNPPRTSGVLLGKSSSLIFPTGVDAPGVAGGDSETANLKRRKINNLLDMCETVRFPFKRKLIFDNMQLTADDIPVKDLDGTSLGSSLIKLSLVGNRLSAVPPRLVQCLPVLKHLDLSQCDLHQLPDKWNLPQLKRLNLSHNRLTEFPEESMLMGLPELQELNMYGNKVVEIIIPHNPNLLAKLETLNLGYNDLAYLPDDLDQLKSLRVLRLMNNFLEKVPMRVCDMELRQIDVSSNPVIQPPIETCERGICSMKRYYHCLRMEEQSKQKQLEELQRKLLQKKKREGRMGLKKLLAPKNLMGSMSASPAASRKQSTGSSVSSSSFSEETPVMASMPMHTHAPMATIPSHSSVATALTPSLDGKAPTDVNRAEAVVSPDDTKLPATTSSVTSATTATLSTAVSVDDDSHHLNRQFHDGNSSNSDFDVTSQALLEGSSSDVDYFRPRSSSSGDVTNMYKSMLASPTSGPDSLSVSHSEEGVVGPDQNPKMAVNDTLKVIFVGMAMAGKTTVIKRLIEGRDAVIPKRDERTVGVDIYEWDPKQDKRFEHIDSRIQLQDKELASQVVGDLNVKFSVWDFAGQHVYHATHELFFSPRALYVLVWDMGATNEKTLRRKNSTSYQDQGAFRLSYDSSDEEDDDKDDNDDFAAEEEARRADRALERDIDEKVQFWVDCIQSSAPGAAILPVATFDDFFEVEGNALEEAKRRCFLMKQRLLRHEERSIAGVRQRLEQYCREKRADDEAAIRLRKLLCPYTRPKLIFEDDEDSVVRVSGTRYTGFSRLTEKIISLATGRDKAGHPYPIFRGHVGARIPRMRLEVREVVRSMRDRFKVVEWGFFMSQLQERGLTDVADISDALHFLANVGELSYFGGVINDRNRQTRFNEGEGPLAGKKLAPTEESKPENPASSDDDDEDIDEDEVSFAIDNDSVIAPGTKEGSLSTVDDFMSTGLSQFVFLNPRWLVAAVACILRHDLDREIRETRRLLLIRGKQGIPRSDSFYEANLNCPVITAQDACMLWKAKKFTKKAAERALEHSNDSTMKPFEFLQMLLVRFGVFVPIDLSIDRAFLGGKEYARSLNDMTPCDMEELPPAEILDPSPLQAEFFFLPSLLGYGEPAEAWTYKNTDSWKATLCHSVLFPDGVPPGLMERVTASVLSTLYAVSNLKESVFAESDEGNQIATYEGRLILKEILCWRTAFFIKLGSQVQTESGEIKESIVEIFSALVDRDSHLCVGSDRMGAGMRRLILSGRGQVGDGGRKIWKGGYLLVIKAVRRVVEQYGGLEREKHAFCPECLAKKAVSEASCWDMSTMRSSISNGDGTIRCSYGHRVDTRLVMGPFNNNPSARVDLLGQPRDSEQGVPVNDLLRAVVVVGLWDGKSNKVVRVGSGFIVDKKRGLIVTASHTLMNIWGDKKFPFGENYYGLRQGKVVIGIIPRNKDSDEIDGTRAVFRYFAKIVAKDPSIEEKGECHIDACVLRITTRMETDVEGDGEGCGEQPEKVLLNNPEALKREKLQNLKVTEKCELDEQVRILGYNQGGEGLLGPGESLNRYVDFARGYVCKKFASGEETDGLRHHFKPREEIVVICPTIGGHSGGPCVNQQGEVIGILSRADPAENNRCYLVPTHEWKVLVKQAKNIL